MNQNSEFINVLRKEHLKISKEGLQLIYHRIEKWEKTQGIKPIVDKKILQLAIRKRIIECQSHVSNIQKKAVNSAIWSYLLDKSFECKLLEYKLGNISK